MTRAAIVARKPDRLALVHEPWESTVASSGLASGWHGDVAEHGGTDGGTVARWWGDPIVPRFEGSGANKADGSAKLVP